MHQHISTHKHTLTSCSFTQIKNKFVICIEVRGGAPKLLGTLRMSVARNERSEVPACVFLAIIHPLYKIMFNLLNIVRLTVHGSAKAGIYA